MQKGKTIYIKGAYGPGNLGDDVLLLCLIKILSSHFEQKNIIVGVEDVSKARILHDKVCFVHYKKPVIADYIVYGGGGQFFDFESLDSKKESSFFNKVKNFIKRNRNIYWAIKRIVISRMSNCHENLVVAEKGAMYSLGLGPFEYDGPGKSRLIRAIAKCEYISLRDKKSLAFAREITDKDITLTADPSFVKNDWVTNLSSDSDTHGDIYDLTLILRDWPYSISGRSLIDRVIEFGNDKVRDGKKVRFVFLYKGYDKNTLKKVQGYDCLQYDPVDHSPEDFVRMISIESKVIISSRAHGIWLPVIFGVPVIGVEIENKITQVCNSLPNSTLTISSKTKSIDEVVEKFLVTKESMTNLIEQDLAKNVGLNMVNKEKFSEWIEA